ncbi:MAG: efflux RND transporter periplasmic adaptor subunit [Oscillospiraceae bacterium]
MEKKYRVISIIVCLSMIASMAVGCGKKAPTESAIAAKVIVQTQTPQIADIALSTEFTGRIEPNESVMVLPKSGGEVMEVNFKVGDTVNKGDVLFRMDSTYIELQAETAQAGYDLAVAQTNQALGSSMDQAILQAKSAYEQARNGFKTARDSFDDYDDTFDDTLRGMKAQVEMAGQGADAAKAAYEAAVDNGLPAKDIMKAKDAYEMAQSRYDAVYQSYKNLDANDDANVKQFETGKDNAKLGLDTTAEMLDLIQGKSREEATKIVEAQLNQITSNMKMITKQLEDTLVRSPISGVVEMCDITAHNMADTQTQAFLISNKSLMTTKFNVSADAVTQMAVGDSITVSNGRKDYKGTITEISTMVGATTGLFQVKASVEDAADLYTGVTVVIKADTEKAKNALTVPLQAVYYDTGKPYVYIIKDDIATKTYVTLGIDNNKQVEVLSGISPKDKIVTTWDAKLIDGAKVVDATSVSQKATEKNPVPLTKEDEEAAKKGQKSPSALTKADAATATDGIAIPAEADAQTDEISNTAETKPVTDAPAAAPTQTTDSAAKNEQ